MAIGTTLSGTIVPGSLAGGTIPISTAAVLIDGVFKGGGSLGAAYPGVMRALEARGMWFRRVAGTSAGSILSCMIAAGYHAAEIEFLSAPTEMNLPRPPGLPAALGAHEVDYSTFEDAPSPADLLAAKEYRHSIAWLVTRQMVDVLAKMSGPLPNKGAILDAALAGIAAVTLLAKPLTERIRGEIEHRLPGSVAIGDLISGDIGTRDGMADALFAPGAANLAGPLEIFLSHIGLTGGIFKGDAFLNRMRRILEAKIDPAVRDHGPVLFRHLPIDLFVTSTNITRESLIVYSKRRTPDMEVAEAVRRSMSVPFVWAARVQGPQDPATVTATNPLVAATGDQLVDGGVLDNLPVWVFLTPTNAIVENTADDLRRPKIVGLLDGGANAPAAWNAPAAPASVPAPDDALGMFMTSMGQDPARSTWEAALLTRVNALYNTTNNGSAVGTSITAAYAAGGGAQVVGVDIPLNGFGWLDPKTTPAKYKAMAFRGWQATMDAVSAAGLGSHITLVANAANPYR